MVCIETHKIGSYYQTYLKMGWDGILPGTEPVLVVFKDLFSSR